ncbi:membrane protein [Streptomyces fumigatiscleroticus]|nr:membrane protein [Streptomyces fumigatiscleroticus]
MAAPLKLTRMHRVLIGVVVTGAVVIAGIGFAGSYAAVRELAVKKGFGDFSYVFPIGIDAGICVLLALDLLLTWIRIPFPLLRQTAWLLTAATIAFNGAAAWPDPLGVGMHAVIPVLFVVAVEAARHAIGRIADITADKHMEGVRLTRWLLSPVPTFLLWRRMKLWELRSYEQVIKLEQERLVYQARLRSRFGRAWRRKAPVESLMPLRLARYGVPLAETAPAGLAAAGVEPVLIPPPPPSPQQALDAAPPAGVPVDGRAALAARADGPAARGEQPHEPAGTPAPGQQPAPGQRTAPGQQPAAPRPEPEPEFEPEPEESPWFRPPQQVEYHGDYDPTYDPEQYALWEAEQQEAERYRRQHQQHDEEPPAQEFPPEETGSFPIPAGPNRTRELGDGGGAPEPGEEDYYLVFRQSINGSLPTPREFADGVEATYGISLQDGEAKRMVTRFSNRFNAELEEDHIA